MNNMKKLLTGFSLLTLFWVHGNLLAQTTGSETNVYTNEKIIRLATLEWPPYNGLLLPQEGIATRVATLAARASGYRLLTSYDEWTKTVEKGMNSPGFDGFFPEYFTKEREQSCHVSQSIGTSLLGVATLKRNAFNWNDMSDLSVYTLGVVDGYSNGETFDNLVKDKKQLVELAPSDAANTQKLLQGKVKGIVIDRNVLRYTLSRLKTKEVVVFNPKPIAELTLHVCFQKTAKGKKLKEEFDGGLKQINLKRAEAEYLNLFRYD